MARGDVSGIRRLLLAAVVLAALFLLSLAGLKPPRPVPAAAPAEEFSAARALEVLRRLVGDDIPHPIGSAADDAVRSRILAELARLGYQPQVQTAFACTAYAACGTVNNVLARLDGAEAPATASDAPQGTPAILLAAHYDSVPAGPGASDDGTGVAAVLEIARALKSLPRPRHSIIFLLDEGEEAGLLGARAFVDSHPWAKDVRAAVNLDARGTSGPSLMYETGSANEWTVALYAAHAPRPSTTSIFYSIYKRLPYDTDFTIFRDTGAQGLNFAFIGGAVDYHTRLDNFAHVHAASLQHHGDNALPAVLALANADLSSPPRREAVFFDLFGRTILRWPASRALPLALAAALLLALQIAWMLRNGRFGLPEYYWGLIAWAAMLALTAALALVLKRLIWLTGALPVNWVAHPLPLEITFWLLPLAVVVTHSVAVSARTGFWALWAGLWTWWALLAIGVACFLPGASYLLFVPSAVAALAGLPFAIPRSKKIPGASLAAILPLAAAALVGFPPALLLYDGLGARGLVPSATAIALLLTPFAPLCADLRGVTVLRRISIPAILITATALAACAAAILPPYSAQAPERVNIRYALDADSAKAQWIADPDSGHLPDALRAAATFHRLDRGPFPWDTSAAYVAEAPRLDLPAPTFTILGSLEGSGQRTFSTLLRSERGAPEAMLFFPPDAEPSSVRIGGVPLEPQSPVFRRHSSGWTVYRCVAMPAEGVEISFALPEGRPVQVFVLDRSYGLPEAGLPAEANQAGAGLPAVAGSPPSEPLPPAVARQRSEGAFLLNARPLTATPSQDGDLTVVSRSVQLIP